VEAVIVAIKLNCDLGEGSGGDADITDAASTDAASTEAYSVDAGVMPFIDQASIACGFHAGDPQQIHATLALAQRAGVSIGAHPSYRDREGFGRRSMSCSTAEIIALMHYQIAALEGMARCQGLSLAYVKPHGALYNDMMAQSAVRSAVLTAMSSYHQPLPLMVLATGEADAHRLEARAHGVELLFEGFADRRYGDDGRLLPRTQPGAILDREAMLAQVQQLCQQGTVTTVGGSCLALQIDSLCVHGDNPSAAAAIADIRRLLPA
jgi:UPF0271 protein